MTNEHKQGTKNNCSTFSLSANKIAKSYSIGLHVFSNIDFEVTNGQIIGITGENGAGKSTLVRMLCGVLSPSKGEITLIINSKHIDREQFHSSIGLVAPYLNLYEEFSAWEHLELASKLRGIKFEEGYCTYLLEHFALLKRRNDFISSFSSGMKQRLKYVLALQHRPPILILDEPSANIDSNGAKAVFSMVEQHVELGGGVILATNEERESSMCHNTVFLKKSW
ncbi:MAG: ABC transporter ATP-binding protein [Bacteroidetes bacterium]|nr:ABC transporter ATP-binding protein [Bacteroidota bacterium]